MSGIRAARLLLATTFVAVLILSIAGCQPTAQDSGEQEPLPSPTEATQPGEDAETVAATPTPVETATAPPTAKPEKELAPTKTPTGDATGSEREAAEMAELARKELSALLLVPVEEIVVRSVEAVDWPGAGLGCPEPDVVYAQVVTPGFRVVLEAKGETYEYHSDQGERVIRCNTLRLLGPPSIGSEGAVQDGWPNQPIHGGDVDTSGITPIALPP